MFRCVKMVAGLLPALLAEGWLPMDQPWTPEGVKDEYRPWKFTGGDNLLYENQIMGIGWEEYKLLLNPGSAPVHIMDVALSAGITSFALVNKTSRPDGDLRIYEMLITPQEEEHRKL